MNFFKQNWFKIGILIILVVGIYGLFFILNFSSKNSFLNQKLCADEAAKFFKERYSSDDLINYTDHYNNRLNGCFVEFFGREEFSTGGYNDVMGRLFNVLEKKEYASYYNTSTGQTYCEIDEEKQVVSDCNSEEEFGNFVATYMNN